MSKITLLDHTVHDTADLIAKLYDDDFYYNTMNSKKALSASSMKQLLKSPKKFALQQRMGWGAETKALRDGKLVHCEILEPQKYEEYTFVDVSSKATTKWKLAVETNGKDKTFTKKEARDCSYKAQAFLQNDSCVAFLNGSETEVPMMKEIDGIAIRGKADIYRAGQFIADVKTTSSDMKDVELRGKGLTNTFRYEIDKYDYDLQAYLYTVLFDVPDFYWLCVNGDMDIGIFKASDETLESGKLKLEAALQMYDCFFVDELIDLSQYHKEGTI